MSRSVPLTIRTLRAGIALLVVVALVAAGVAVETRRASADTTFPPLPVLDGSQLSGITGNGMYLATAAEQTALNDIEAQAVQNVMNDHDLPSSDQTAVETWGRDDVLAEMYALLVVAANTPAANRTADQQGIVDWFGEVVQRRNHLAAYNTGLEFSKWAALGAGAYTTFMQNHPNPTASDLHSFFTTHVPFNYGAGDSVSTPPSHDNEGYCDYYPPDPVESSWPASIYNPAKLVTSTAPPECFPNTGSGAGVSPPTPDLSQVQEWGAAATAQATTPLGWQLTMANTVQSLDYLAGITAGIAAGVLVRLALSLAISASGEGSAFLSGLGQFASAIAPFAGRTTFAVADAGADAAAIASTEVGEAELAAIAASQIAALAAVVITGIIVGVQIGLQIFKQTPDFYNNLSNEVAAGVNSGIPDVAADLNDSSQTVDLLTLFGGVVGRAPQVSQCSNLVVGFGSVPCLNAPAVPSSTGAPQFTIANTNGTATTTSSTLTWKDLASNSTHSAYLSGHWWVDNQTNNTVASTVTNQQLAITYTDSNNDERTSWVVGNPGDGFQFLTAATSGISANCISDATCTVSRSITYLGTDGQFYRATLPPGTHAPNVPNNTFPSNNSTTMSVATSPDQLEAYRPVTVTASVFNQAASPAGQSASPVGAVTFAELQNGTFTTLCSAVPVAQKGSINGLVTYPNGLVLFTQITPSESYSTATCSTSLPAGAGTVYATFDGTPNWQSNQAATSVDPGTLAPTLTSVTADKPSTTLDATTGTANVTYTATVSDLYSQDTAVPGGTVTFSSTAGGCHGVPLSNVSGTLTATCQIAFPGSGRYAVTATYSGDGGTLTSSGSAATTVATTYALEVSAPPNVAPSQGISLGQWNVQLTAHDPFGHAVPGSFSVSPATGIFFVPVGVNTTTNNDVFPLNWANFTGLHDSTGAGTECSEQISAANPNTTCTYFAATDSQLAGRLPLSGNFNVTFTPDLGTAQTVQVPVNIAQPTIVETTGTQIYHQSSGSFQYSVGSGNPSNVTGTLTCLDAVPFTGSINDIFAAERGGQPIAQQPAGPYMISPWSCGGLSTLDNTPLEYVAGINTVAPNNLTILPAPQSVLLQAPQVMAAGDSERVTTTASSGDPVMVVADPNSQSLCSVSGDPTAGFTVNASHPGTCVLDASVAVDSNYQPASATASVMIIKAFSNVTGSLDASTPTVNGATEAGEQLTLDATVSVPGSVSPSPGSVGFALDRGAGQPPQPLCAAVLPTTAPYTASCQTAPLLDVGLLTIDVFYGGNGDVNPSPPGDTFQVAMNPATTTVAITPPPNPSPTGGQITVDAKVSTDTGLPPGPGRLVLTPDSANLLASDCGHFPGGPGGFVIAVPATAASPFDVTCHLFYGTAGAHPMAFSYQPDPGSFGSPAQGTASIPVVGPSVQDIQFTSAPPPNVVVGGPPYIVTAVASSGLPVALSIDPSATGVCSLSGTTVSFIGIGTCAIDGTQAGNADFPPAQPIQQSFPVAQGSQTVGFTSNPPPNAVFGGSYPVQGSASSLLPVTFTIDSSSGNGVCSISSTNVVSFTGVGTCVIDANQAGNADWLAAPQVQQTFTVAKASGSVVINNLPTAAAYRGSFSPTYTQLGTGTPSTTSLTPSVCAVAGGTVTFAAAGTCQLQASITPDPDYLAATGSTQSFTVGQATLLVTPAHQSRVFGAPDPTFTSNITGFLNGDTPSVITSQPTCGVAGPHVNAGNYTIGCSGGAAANYTFNDTPTATLTINQDSTTAVVTSSANPSVFGQPVSLTATVTANAPGSGTPTGMVVFTDGTTTLGSAAINTATGKATLPPGVLSVTSHSIQARYLGDNNFTSSSSANLTQSVNPDPTTTAVSSSANPSPFGQAVTFTAKVTANAPGAGTPTGTVQFRIDGQLFGSPAKPSNGVATSSSTATLAPGTHTITATYAGDTNFTTSTAANFSQTISATVVTGTQSGSMTITKPTSISGATINGSITVKSGGSLAISNSTINGPITSSGATEIRICGSTLNGPVSISGTKGFVLIGDGNDDGTSGCPMNTVPNTASASLTVKANLAGFEIDGNQISAPVSVINNTGSGPAPEDTAPEIEGNTIGGPLSCSGNSPAPTNDHQPNKVSGPRGGQCSGSF